MDDDIKQAVIDSKIALDLANKALALAQDNHARYSELDDKLSSAHKRITELDDKLSRKIDDLDKRIDKMEVTLARIERKTLNSSFDSKHIKVLIAIFGTIAGIVFPAVGTLFQ